MGEKKCPYCGKWSTWNQNLRDTCDHCGKILGGKDLEYHEKRQAQKQANEEQWIFNINESDNEFLKFLKKTGNFFLCDLYGYFNLRGLGDRLSSGLMTVYKNPFFIFPCIIFWINQYVEKTLGVFIPYVHSFFG